MIAQTRCFKKVEPDNPQPVVGTGQTRKGSGTSAELAPLQDFKMKEAAK
jgi:hypothetical protein